MCKGLIGDQPIYRFPFYLYEPTTFCNPVWIFEFPRRKVNIPKESFFCLSPNRFVLFLSQLRLYFFQIFLQIFEGHMAFVWGQWYPWFGFLGMSALGFKDKVDPRLRAFSPVWLSILVFAKMSIRSWNQKKIKGDALQNTPDAKF